MELYKNNTKKLTILTGENRVLLSSVEECCLATSDLFILKINCLHN